MASSDPGRDAPADAEALRFPNEPEHVVTPFQRRARVHGAMHGIVAAAFAVQVTEAVRDGGLSAPAWWEAVLVLAGLPTVPLFAALPIPAGVVAVLAALTSLPVWSWAGAAIARRVEPDHGADWGRWARWWPLLPLGGLLMAVVFVGGLTPMG